MGADHAVADGKPKPNALPSVACSLIGSPIGASGEEGVEDRCPQLRGYPWTLVRAAIPKAKRGHSKEKRSDCPLVTLGLVLDSSGFVRRSQVFDAPPEMPSRSLGVGVLFLRLGLP